MATVTKVIMDKDDLQPLADGIKELEGNTSNITLSQMENAISSTNSEINRQGTLISEIISALEGKSVPGGGASVETCNVNITRLSEALPANVIYTTVDANGNITTVSEQTSLFNALVGSCFFVFDCDYSVGACIGAEILKNTSGTNDYIVIKLTATQGETARIDFQGMGGSN